MKIIAVYLPQFHEFEENNLWWGKGYTEWTCLRKSKKMFPGHIIKKPHPDIGYYDLNDIEIRKKQSIIAKEYGIYGFCYYHYWFGGKLLMNSILEKMLIDNEPDLPFCLNWANQAWTRRMNGGNGEILQPTMYGDEPEWDCHLEYLCKFFKHKNYIKINGNPILLIHKISDIKNATKRISYWRDRIKDYGFNDIFLISTLANFMQEEHSRYLDICDAAAEFYPNFLRENISFKNINNKLRLFDMETVFDWIVNYPQLHHTQFKGLMSGFDSSPRNSNLGNIIVNCNPESFGKLLRRQILNSKQNFIFINAWNEWGEGMTLEPDNYWGYDLLKEIKKSKLLL